MLWEAQFGDFINCAQVIVDQYIVAAEDKWGQRNGLVLLLPHGYHGQGPEHSSARIERFLLAAAEDNIQLVQRHDGRPVLPPAAPPGVHRAAHAADRLHAEGRAAPEADPLARIDELTTGSFREVLDDPGVGDPEAVERVVFCSGKVAWDAMAERDKREAPVAVIRVEQLYPLPTEQLLDLLRRRYVNAKQLVWLQEEPENMGAWRFIENRTWRVKELGYDMRHVARVESGSPATGSKAIHDQELVDLMDETFA